MYTEVYHLLPVPSRPRKSHISHCLGFPSGCCPYKHKQVQRFSLISLLNFTKKKQIHLFQVISPEIYPHREQEFCGSFKLQSTPSCA